MNFIKIGGHAINMDRVADIWEENGADGIPTGRVLVYCGDQKIELVGDEATNMVKFVTEIAKPFPAMEMPMKVGANKPSSTPPSTSNQS